MRHTFLFTRGGGLQGVTAAAILTVETSNPEASSHAAAFAWFRCAVTDWLKETKEGRDAWEESVQDFNIGDFVSSMVMVGKAFSEIAARRGIIVQDAYTIAWDQCVPFDRVLGGGGDHNE